MERVFRQCMLATILISGLAGCATTGGDVPAAAPPEPEVDITNEVGDNGLLTPAAIVARFVEALGGEKAMRAHSSATTRGKMELPAMGMSGDLVLYAEAPDKFVLEVEMGGMGTMNQGFNGEVGWSDNPMQGASLLDGEMLDQAKMQADFYAPLRYSDNYPTRETLELTEWSGESAYKVRLVTASGKESTQYFSESTGLLIGAQGSQVSDMGEMDVTTSFADYKEFDGTKVPGTTTIQMMGFEIKQVVESVTFDDVEASAFEPPDSIQALLE